MDAIHIIFVLSFFILAVFLLLVLFEPPLNYVIHLPPLKTDSDEFLALLGALADAQIHGNSHVEVLTNGHAFYDAQLDAIRDAKQSINLEAYLFLPSPVADRFIKAMTERARAGVKVKLVLDAFGSFRMSNRYFGELRAAGGLVAWYQPLRWYTLKRLNNRTHRELMIIDGRIGFIGGAGIARHWDTGDTGRRPWVDKVCRVEGDLVTGLQRSFAENWLESSSEILAGEEYFPRCLHPSAAPAVPSPANIRGLVAISSPTAGRSTRSRILFQTLLAAAGRTIHINSPYFLPDRSASRELIRAAKDRGVEVKIIVPGKFNNHFMTRFASRRRYGPLLQNGVRLYEYKPGMIHAKVMIIDGHWSVMGSTNFDSRSFDLNDEVNLAVLDPALSARLAEDFQADLSNSHEITFEQWRKRPLVERFFAQVGRIMERQE